MIDSSAGLRLGDEFPPTTLADWRAAVDKVLARGAELTSAELDERFDRELVTRTVDGLVIRPLYVDLGDAPEPGVSGSAPFTRGSEPLAHRGGGWDVRQRVVAGVDAATVAAQVIHELERGSTSVLLDVGGVAGVDIDYLDAVLRDVLLDVAPVVLTGATEPIAAAEALLGLFARRGVSAEVTESSLGLDPLGRWVATATGDIADGLSGASRLAVRCAAEAPRVRALVVDATVVHEAGGGDVEELAYAAAAGIEYLRSLADAGADIDTACSQIGFRFAATPDQFLTIAKFRAARRMWQRVTSVSGADGRSQAQHQHAMSSTAAASRYGVWVNLLRGTVECFGAGVGGADAVTILPHDELLGGSDLGRRIARNTQLVLIEESNLAKVIDIAGGSWYVEQLTDQLARAAWDLMQDLERVGGLVAAVEQGVLQDRVDATRTRRDTAIASRKMAMTGVTEFPDITESVPSAPASPSEPAGGAPKFAPLRPRRYADAVEAQRRRSDALAATPAGRPTVFLAAVGSTASNAARVSFAKNLFEVGGIEAIVGDSAGDAAEIRNAFERSGARLACICAADAVYAQHAVAVAEALHAAGAGRLYLAGRPKGMEAELAAAGVDEQIAVGSDVVSVLRTALDTIGAPS